MMQCAINIAYKKVIIFKHAKHTYIGNYTGKQIKLSFMALRVFYKYAGKIIYYYCKAQYEYINRHKHHVEVATGRKQKPCPVLMREHKIECGNHNKKIQKLEGIK